MAKAAKTQYFGPAHSAETPTVGVSDHISIATPRHSDQDRLGLAEIVRLVNLARPGDTLPPLSLVPLNEDLPAPPRGEWPQDFQFRAWAVRSDHATLQQWLDRRLRGLPEEFRDYVTHEVAGWHVFWFFGAIDRYNFVREARQTLRLIITSAREAQDAGHLPFYLNLKTNSVVAIDESWILRKAAADDFDAVLFETELDARNIRECAVCGRIFLARRVDSVVCDPGGRCAKTHSKRNERANAKLRAELEAKRESKKKRAQTARKR